MQVPQIRLQSQQAQIELQTRPATQTIEQPKAQMEIQQPHAELQIHTIPGKLSIDQTEAWEEMDIKSVFRRTEENAQYGKQKAMEGIARIASEGDQLMKIENSRKVIVEQSAQRALENQTFDTNITWIPSFFSVKTDYQPAEVTIDWNTHQANINVKTQKPIITYQPGEVTARLKQHQALNIDFTL